MLGLKSSMNDPWGDTSFQSITPEILQENQAGPVLVLTLVEEDMEEEGSL